MKARLAPFALFALLWTCPLAQGQDMPLTQILEEGSGWELVVEGYEFADGLSSDAEGHLYFSDVKGGDAVYRVDPEGKVAAFVPEAPGISGLKWGSDGRLYACVARQQRVVVFDETGKASELAAEVRPNDLVVTHDGNLYFTMTPTSEIRRIDPSGKMSVVSAGVVARPNGIALSPDQGTLAVSDHGGKHAWTFRIEPDGSLAHPGAYMELRTPAETPEVSKGDGMATDVHGRYYVTSAVGLQIFDPTGRLCGVLPSPDPAVPMVSVAFAGPGHAWLHVANGGKIWRRKTKTRGALGFEPPHPNEAPPK